MCNNEGNELISILMPTYNVAPYVEAAVQSIISQTYRNFELIIVDDCSIDGTYEILQNIARTDARIVLLRNDVNSKICVTLNRAWSLAKGKYIGRMDGDDISLPKRFEILKNFLENNPNVDLAGSQLVSIDQNGKILSYKKYLRSPLFIKYGNRTASCISHIWLAKREVYETLNAYRNIPYAEDYDFLLRGEEHGYRYANVEEYLYKVRIRPGNTGYTNGLKQIKTKRYVQSLHGGKALHTEENYRAALLCTVNEQTRFLKAQKHLSNAIIGRGNRLKMIYNVIAGCCSSKYIFMYILEALWIRMLLLTEDILYPRRKIRET